jgi:hypothetical protein
MQRQLQAQTFTESERRQKVIFNISLNKPTATKHVENVAIEIDKKGESYCDFYSLSLKKPVRNRHSQRVAANFGRKGAGNHDHARMNQTIVILEGPVTITLLCVLFPSFHKQPSCIQEATSFADEDEQVVFVNVDMCKSETWEVLQKHFGSGPDALWYMMDTKVVVGEKKEIEHALRAKEHFPGEGTTIAENGKMVYLEKRMRVIKTKPLGLVGLEDGDIEDNNDIWWTSRSCFNRKANAQLLRNTRTD